MTSIELLNFPDDIETDLKCEFSGDKVRFTLNDMSTSWMDFNDSFIERIQFDGLNRDFLDRHLAKEIEIKNILDRAIGYLKREKYPKAVKCLDEVIYYDECYAVAILNKSYALKGQGHFVKSLRNYKKAIKCDGRLKDIEYHRNLLKKANSERDNFPKIKLNIYTGDEYFMHGEYEKAVESYDRALGGPSKFRDKILPKLLSKKATALVEMEKYDEALSCFKESLRAGASDYAYFGCGLCEYELGFEISNRFKKPLKIAKRQSLKQALILNRLGFYTQSLQICDILAENHFKVDDFYLKLMDERSHALKNME